MTSIFQSVPYTKLLYWPFSIIVQMSSFESWYMCHLAVKSLLTYWNKWKSDFYIESVHHVLKKHIKVWVSNTLGFCGTFSFTSLIYCFIHPRVVPNYFLLFIYSFSLYFILCTVSWAYFYFSLVKKIFLKLYFLRMFGI